MYSAAKISVLIPYFNHEEHLEKAVQSVLGQSYPPYEIIIVDDFSNKTADKVLKKLSGQTDIPFRIFRHNTNKGVSASRNTGIAMAGGQFLAFLDADDCWSPQHLKHFVEAFNHYNEIHFYSTGSVYFRNNCPGFNMDKPAFIQENYLDLALKNSRYVNASSVIFSKQLLEKTGKFDTDFILFEDIDYWIRAGKYSKVVFNQSKNVFIRQSRQSLSRDLKNYNEKTLIPFFEKYLYDDSIKKFIQYNIAGTILRFKKSGNKPPAFLYDLLDESLLSFRLQILLKLPANLTRFLYRFKKNSD